MNIYMAPMEGITGHVYRRAHYRCFGDIDRYFTPFLTNIGLNHKELQDISPENNKGMNVVPQILTNRTEIFLELARILQDYGYQEINLNLGCPSGTVTAKGRGAGFLRFPRELDEFLWQIFEACPLKISVKTRVGYSSEEEWPAILEILEKYPFTEIIIHPRLRQDFYRGNVRWETYEMAENRLAQGEGDRKIRLCYNGDIHCVADYHGLLNRFPNTACVMLGRGLIANPGLSGELKGNHPMDREKLETFLDELLWGYRSVMSEEKNILFRLLEMWSYLYISVPGGEKLLKKIRKTRNLEEYQRLVRETLKNEEDEENAIWSEEGQD